MTSWTAADIGDQSGRVALVTGANSGLGLRSAQALARAGAQVVLGCRSETKAAAALDEVGSVATGPAAFCVPLDLADLSSVQACAKVLSRRVDRLDILMNNAGVMAIPLARTADGFEAQFGTNHLGHFALTGQLLPLLLRAPAPRVVTTSSQMHRVGRMRWNDPHWRRGYRKWLAYGQSKLANLLFAFELARRATEHGAPLVSAAAHPGYASTHLQAVGPELTGNAVMGRIMSFANRYVAQPDEMGAWPQLYAATADGIENGAYYGPAGVFEMRGHPSRVRATAAARRAEDARRLWELSERETGVTYDWTASE